MLPSEGLEGSCASDHLTDYQHLILARSGKNASIDLNPLRATLIGMPQRFGSYLMLLVMGTCPVLCRSSLAATRPVGDAAWKALRGSVDSCCDAPMDGHEPTAPHEPCKNTTCFCSPFVMHQTSSGLAALLALTAGPDLATCEEHADSWLSPMQTGFWEKRLDPASFADHSVALPLLI